MRVSPTLSSSAPTAGPTASWRELPIPEDMVVIVDNREQLPLFVDLPFVRGGTLQNGDYSLDGFEHKVFIELKRLSDFFSYIGAERVLKTEPKLKRLDDFFFRGLCVVESEATLFSSKQLHTKLGPEHVRGFVTSLNVRYGVHFYANPNEDAVRRWVLDRLIYCFKMIRNGEIS